MGLPSKRALRRLWRPFRIIVGFALLGVAAWVVDGKSSELSGAGAFLSQPRWLFLAFAAVAEFLSYLGSAFLQRSLLRAGDVRASAPRMTVIAFASNTIQSALPVGAAFAGLFLFGQYQLLGADEVLAGWVVIGSAGVLFATLAAIAGVSLALSASTGSTFDLVYAILGVLFLALVVAGLWAKRRVAYRYAIAAATSLEKRLHRPAGQLRDPLARNLERIQTVAPSSKEWLVVLAWGSSIWLTDCTCFMFSLLAVGAPVPWQGLLLAYCGGQLAVNLPITPGGLGVVEGTLTIALIAFDPSSADKAATVAAVLLYRLLSFWAPLPIGAICYAGLLRARRRLTQRAEENGLQATAAAGSPAASVVAGGTGPATPAVSLSTEASLAASYQDAPPDGRAGDRQSSSEEKRSEERVKEA